jgi:hypothetical protein
MLAPSPIFSTSEEQPMRQVFLYAMQGLMVLAMPAATGNALAESLSDYARTCAAETNTPVKGFNCMDGYEINMTPGPGGTCAKPPYLTSAPCRAGSRLGVQVSTPELAVVWLCRKKSVTDRSSSIFDDIAVIQTNFTNGATCFYQRLEDSGVDGRNVPAPETNTGDFWFQPAEAKDQECASCHNTGLLRTPYLTQVRDNDKQVLPTQRHTTHYWFPGKDFAGWNGQVFQIIDDAKTKTCTQCHPMGANTIDPDFGTSTWLGLMATGAKTTPHLNPPSDARAFWMRPRLLAPSDKDIQAANRMSDCALGGGTDCRWAPWGGQLQAVIDALAACRTGG